MEALGTGTVTLSSAALSRPAMGQYIKLLSMKSAKFNRDIKARGFYIAHKIWRGIAGRAGIFGI